MNGALALLCLSFFLLSLVHSQRIDYCSTAPECTIYPKKQGFRIKHIDQCSCLHNLGGVCPSCPQQKQQQQQKMGGGRCGGPVELCTAYYTCRPEPCVPYVPLELLANQLTIFLNLENWEGVASLLDALTFTANFNTGNKLSGACDLLTYLLNLGSTGGTFDITSQVIVDQGEVAYLEMSFVYDGGVDPVTQNPLPPTSFLIVAMAMRNGCNNWVFTTQYWYALVQ